MRGYWILYSDIKWNTKCFGASGLILGLQFLVARVVPRGFRLGLGNRVILPPVGPLVLVRRLPIRAQGVLGSFRHIFALSVLQFVPVLLVAPLLAVSQSASAPPSPVVFVRLVYAQVSRSYYLFFTTCSLLLVWVSRMLEGITGGGLPNARRNHRGGLPNARG